LVLRARRPCAPAGTDDYDGKRPRTADTKRWANLRHSIIGGAAGGRRRRRGELARCYRVRLAEKTWRHPLTGKPVCFGVLDLGEMAVPGSSRPGHADTVNAPPAPGCAGTPGRVRRGVPRWLVTALVQLHRESSDPGANKLHADKLGGGWPRPTPRSATRRRTRPCGRLMKSRRAISPEAAAGNGMPRRRRQEPGDLRVAQRPGVTSCEYVHGAVAHGLPHGGLHSRCCVRERASGSRRRSRPCLDDRFAAVLATRKWYLEDTAENLGARADPGHSETRTVSLAAQRQTGRQMTAGRDGAKAWRDWAILQDTTLAPRVSGTEWENREGVGGARPRGPAARDARRTSRA